MEEPITESARLNSLALEQAGKIHARDFGYYSYDVSYFDKIGVFQKTIIYLPPAETLYIFI